jgi:hypothetical protein
MSVIGKCPDCGWPIYDGHVMHICALPPVVSDEGGYTASVSVGPFDFIVIRRSALEGNPSPPTESEGGE